MRKPKVILATAIVGFTIGMAVAAILPQPALAVGCKFTCYELRCRVPDFGDCTQSSYAVYKYYPNSYDVECGGPFNCTYNGTPVACVDNCGEIPPPEI